MVSKEYKQSSHRRKIIRKAVRKHRYREMYGINVDEYERLFNLQGGLCAMCGSPPRERDDPELELILMVDHNHRTGMVRGLLCMRCNAFLGEIEKRGYLQQLSDYAAECLFTA